MVEHNPDTAPSGPTAPAASAEHPTADAAGNAPDAPGTSEHGDGAAVDGERDHAFRLELPLFQGPLELLLHLIERDELDVTEVSLLSVTEQYMQHLRSTEQINLGALADFISVGARLILLKSRALLPREEGAAFVEDPDSEARELIEALREYRRFKEAAEFFRERDSGHATYRRQAAPPKVTLPTGLDTVTLDSLTELIREVLTRLPEEEPTGEVYREPVRLRDRMSSLVDALERDGRTSFRRLIEAATSRVVVIVDFLAVLELIKSGYLEARQAEAFGDIDLVRRDGAARPDVVALAAGADLDSDDADDDDDDHDDEAHPAGAFGAAGGASADGDVSGDA